ncbi:MAG: glycoside hydrolase family 2 protein [Acidimicrobiales bacterium]
MDLGGRWLAAVADEELRRVYAAVDFDDSSWETIDVPGHWRTAPAFAASDGPLLYRRRFEHRARGEGRRHWLVLDGLFYQGDVWLDGAYLGETEGYFAPHTFEITEPVGQGDEHVLAVEVTCAPQTDVTAKRNLTGILQHWDCIDPGWNPGGIWRPVRIEETGSIRIRDLRVLCREATPERAVVEFRANLETVEATPVCVRSNVGGVDHGLNQSLAAGQNHLEWTVTVDDPALWWPWSLGDQPLQDVAVEVAVGDRPDEVSHRRTLRTGLRRVDMRDWIFSVNGERLFLKGANYGPTRMPLADAAPAEIATDVDLAKGAGLDLLRLPAHISRPELYDAADEAGMLLWQDLPLHGGYSRSVRKQAVRQAGQAVRSLGHHPSIAVWCGHNEPLAVDAGGGGHGLRFVAAQELPTWNRTVLDRSIKRALRREDGTRPVIPHSGVWPHLPKLDGTDSHLYFGWYHGDERDLPRFLAAVPRMARFVSEFGAQAVPETADFCEPDRWPDLDWDRLAEQHCLQKQHFARYVPPDEAKDFDDWRTATQAYQARLLKRHVEELRRLKYRPTGGFCQFLLADAMPAVTWSVLGHDRRAKLGYQALAQACAPVIVVADRLPPSPHPGDAVALDVHVVSDRRQPLRDLAGIARLVWPGGGHEWRFAGDVPADACVRVGTLQFETPDAPGSLVLELEVSGGDLPAPVTNRDEAVVRAD